MCRMPHTSPTSDEPAAAALADEDEDARAANRRLNRKPSFQSPTRTYLLHPPALASAPFWNIIVLRLRSECSSGIKISIIPTRLDIIAG